MLPSLLTNVDELKEVVGWDFKPFWALALTLIKKQINNTHENYKNGS